MSLLFVYYNICPNFYIYRSCLSKFFINSTSRDILIFTLGDAHTALSSYIFTIHHHSHSTSIMHQSPSIITTSNQTIINIYIKSSSHSRFGLHQLLIGRILIIIIRHDLPCAGCKRVAAHLSGYRLRCMAEGCCHRIQRSPSSHLQGTGILMMVSR